MGKGIFLTPRECTLCLCFYAKVVELSRKSVIITSLAVNSVLGLMRFSLVNKRELVALMRIMGSKW